MFMVPRDLSGESDTNFLIDTDYAARNLRNANFEGAKLHRFNFAGADCRGANFRGAHLSGVNGRCANFAGADFTEAKLENCDLMGTDLRGACFRSSYLRSVILINAILTETKGRTLAEGANFYQCDLLFDLLKFGILRRLKTPYDYVGVLTPAMAARFAIHANTATERVGDLGNRLDVHSLGLDGIVLDWPLVRMALLDTVNHIEQHPEHYGPYCQQKQSQVKRLIEEVGGSENALTGRATVLTPNCWLEHPRQWLPVLALPGIEIQKGVRGNSLLSQAFNVLNERKRLQPYGSQEQGKLIWPHPESDHTRGFCDAENRLKELYIERWLSWLNSHPEKITLIQAILTLCQSQDSEASKRMFEKLKTSPEFTAYIVKLH